MKVWVLETGENHEGGTIVGVYAEKPSDEVAVSAVRVPFSGTWEKTGDGTWSNSCDYIALTDHEVIP